MRDLKFSRRGTYPLNKAFTLAEVLITLGVIGVVAAMTLPSVITNYKEKETVVRLKKAYSIISNAYTLILEKYDDPSNWGLTKDNYSSIATNYFAENMKNVQICSNDGKECFVNIFRKDMRNNPTTQRLNSKKGIITPDGIVIGFTIQDEQQLSECIYLQYCFNAVVDINGDKGPNRWGVDTFIFHVKKDKIVPRGMKNTSAESTSTCSTDSDGHIGWFNGSGCTAWVLYNENMDYLKCINGNQNYCNTRYYYFK